ncbi:MAG: alpha-amylase, partial [Microbacterium sp.]|nr:alpha-amylase [Microbacterium sp.]
LNVGDEPVSLPVADGLTPVAGEGWPTDGRVELGPRGWVVLEA